MTPESKKIVKSAKILHHLQREQVKSVRGIGRMCSKLEKRNAKLQTMEVRMANLEQRLFILRNPVGQLIAKSAKGLRPARLIINPNSGTFVRQVDSPEKLAAILRAHGIQAEVYLKTSSKAVRKWVREAVDKDEELIIAVGGDGIVEDVGLLLVGSRTLLGIIPTGVMNNHARGLGIPIDIEQACTILGAGITRQIDVCCISQKNENPTQEEADFVVIPRAINVIVGQGSGFNWPVDVVHCVPTLTGAQVPSKSDPAAEQSIPTNGAEHGFFEGQFEKVESYKDRAR